MGRRKIDVDINQISEELHIFQKTHNRVPTSGDKLYEEKIKIKIDLCNENNLKLIQIYPQLLWNSKQSEILEYVLEQIKIFD